MSSSVNRNLKTHIHFPEKKLGKGFNKILSATQHWKFCFSVIIPPPVKQILYELNMFVFKEFIIAVSQVGFLMSSNHLCQSACFLTFFPSAGTLAQSVFPDSCLYKTHRT